MGASIRTAWSASMFGAAHMCAASWWGEEVEVSAWRSAEPPLVPYPVHAAAWLNGEPASESRLPSTGHYKDCPRTLAASSPSRSAIAFGEA